MTKERKPYWYMRLVEENKLEDFGLCDYRNHLQMHNLDDNDLQKIFVEYIKKNKNRYMQIHGVDVDVKLCEIEAKKIINKMEKECKTPLYVMYIADAWISDDNKKGRNWNKEETLEYVIRKEDERLKSFFEGNREKEAALKRITTFSVVLNGINLGKRCPKFLYREFELIREEFGYDNPNLRHLFNEIGEIEYTKDIAFKSALPEIVGEFYCLRYLSNIIDNSFDDSYVRQFIECAWAEDSRSFAGFLCRVIEDFPDHKLVNFNAILEMPDFCNLESKMLYADVLREYTFWNKEVLNYINTIINNFEKLFCKEKCKEIFIDIIEKYAIALFNMAWWCKCEKNSNKISNCNRIILNKMYDICRKVNNPVICQVCRGIKTMLDERNTMECYL